MVKHVRLMNTQCAGYSCSFDHLCIHLTLSVLIYLNTTVDAGAA